MNWQAHDASGLQKKQELETGTNDHKRTPAYKVKMGTDHAIDLDQL